MMNGIQSHSLCVTNSLILCVAYFTVMLLILKTVIRTGEIQQLMAGLLSNYKHWSENEDVCVCVCVWGGSDSKYICVA
jgi:hypothetical protein